MLFQQPGSPSSVFSQGSYLCSKRFLYFLINLTAIFHCDAKPFALGPGVGLDPQCHNFALGVPTCWYLQTLKFALPPMQNPSTSQWNIGYVGSPTQNLFTQREPSLQWNVGLRIE